MRRFILLSFFLYIILIVIYGMGNFLGSFFYFKMFIIGVVMFIFWFSKMFKVVVVVFIEMFLILFKIFLFWLDIVGDDDVLFIFCKRVFILF